MVNKSKNLNINLSNPISDSGDLTPERNYYVNVFCPKCGKFNVRRHRIFKSRYSCDNCGYRWKR